MSEVKEPATLLQFPPPAAAPAAPAITPIGTAKPRALPAHSGSGHRERLKEKFQQADGAGLADYELLELALTFAIPRKDVKPLAKQLLKQFGGSGHALEGVLNASAAALTQVEGLGAHSVTFLRLVGALARRVGRQKLHQQPPLANQLALYDYMYALFGEKNREEVHVLYLNSQQHLLADETIFQGTLTQSPASPREILQRALSHNAAGLILAHNHPSGVPTPSTSDHEFTHALGIACASLNLTLHDHLIVGHSQIFSFKTAGHL